MKAHIDDHLDEIATAIVRQLRGRTSSSLVAAPAGEDLRPLARPGLSVRRTKADGDVPGTVVVGGTRAERGAVVAAAVDNDDIGPGPVVRYAAAQARRRGVPLRVVHVWTERAATRHGVRMTQHDWISDADLLLSGVLYEHLTAADADATEREILHDRDVVRALIALSAEAALMVVNARGTTAVNGEPLGDTVRGLVGRTACPLAVLAPAAPISVTRGAW